LGLNYEKWKETMLSGCVADYDQMTMQERSLASLLDGDEEVHITTPYGTDLKFRLDRRRICVSGGLTSKEKAERGIVTFLPAGAVEVSANEASAEGKVVYDVPVNVGNGVVAGLTLRIENGRIVKFAVENGKELFSHYLEEGKGDSDRFAFFGFGLNPNLRHGFTQDDKALGGVTVGFGDNENKGGKNKPFGHEFWASMTGATVTIGNNEVMRSGRLQV
jgi:leucyl aminopeptidase (aminopeptidase T)